MLTVLLIDDEEPIRLLCRVNLEAAGMAVLEASDGVAGVQAARDGRPDVILLDVMMPGPDGWHVAEELLGDDRTSSIPIVFLTARAEMHDPSWDLESGGFDYVTKPFNPIDLAQHVQTVAERVVDGEPDELRQARIARLQSLFERGGLRR